MLSVEGRARGTERVLDQGDGGRSCREGTPAALSVTQELRLGPRVSQWTLGSNVESHETHLIQFLGTNLL